MVQKNKGFTLVEVLLVIGIISVLASVVIIAINPARQMAQARNTQRWSNVNTILNAVQQYAVANKGSLPGNISSSTLTEICNTGTGGVASTSCGALTNLWQVTENEVFLVGFPSDPSCPDGCGANGVGYKITRSVNGRLTVTAPLAELNEAISITR